MTDMYNENEFDKNELEDHSANFDSSVKTTNYVQPNIVGADNPIVKGVNPNIENSIFKNLKNMDSLGKVRTAGAIYAGASSLLNVRSQQRELGSSLDDMQSAINKMIDSKTEISDSLRNNISEINENLSEDIQSSAVATLSKNKDELMNLSNQNVDFGSGQVKQAASRQLSRINEILETTYDAKKKRSEDIIDKNINQARYSTSVLSNQINRVGKEMGKVKKAKSKVFSNALLDVAGLASQFYDPTGATKALIHSAKYENEYT